VAFATVPLVTVVLDIRYNKRKGVCDMTEEQFALSWARRLPDLKHIAIFLEGDHASNSRDFDTAWLLVIREESGEGNDIVNLRRLSADEGRPLTRSMLDVMMNGFHEPC
jgi:hypothetical protein